MAKKTKATCLDGLKKASPKVPVIGVFSPCDPRIDEASRKRAQNIIAMVADTISGQVVLPDKTLVPVVYSDVLIDSEGTGRRRRPAVPSGRCRYPCLCPGHLGLSATDNDFSFAAVQPGHPDQHHLRQQRTQARRRLCPRALRRHQSIRQDGAPERRQLARHRDESKNERTNRNRFDRLVLRSRHRKGTERPTRHGFRS